MAQETSATIAQWAEATFGSVQSLERLVDRAQQELAELRQAITNNSAPADIAKEAADVVILLHRVAALSGHDLAETVDAKMVINRQRRWQPSGDGVGQHL